MITPDANLPLMIMKKIRKITLLICIATAYSCIAEKGKINVNIKKNESLASASVSSVQIVNHQLIINGKNLDSVSNVNVSGQSLNQNFTIETKSNSQIIANAVNAFSFDVSKVFSLIISTAEGSATFPIDFSICNSTLNGKGFNCSITAIDKDVLSYDATSGTWKPRAATGINYLGAFNASTNPPVPNPTPFPAAGSYYIVSADGMIGSTSFVVGDWLISNGTVWQKIGNSTLVTSVFSRTGHVVAQEGDYNLDLLADVDLSVAPVNGKVLKYNGTHWVAADDLTGGGAGSVTTTAIADSAVTDAKINSVSASKITGTITSSQILDGTIVNADINASAAIDYSKLNIPAGSIPYAKLTIADGSIPAAKITGLPAATAILATTITSGDSTHAPDGNAVFQALAQKIGVTGAALTGAGTISNVPDPVAPGDAANRNYVDTTTVSKTGDTMSGDLNLDADLNLKGTTNYVTIKAGASTAAYTLTLPLNAGTNGQVLTTNGASPAVLTWTTPASGGGSGTVTSVTGSGPISVTNTTTTPAISIATANTTTTGVLSSTDWNTFNSKATSTLADGSIFIGNGSNVATAAAVSGDVTITNTGVTSIGANKVTNTHIADNSISLAKLTALGTITPTSSSPYSPVSTGDTVTVAFNKTQGQLNYVAANAVTKDGTNFLTGSTAVQGMTARLTVPTPIITDLSDATNVQYVSTAISNAIASLPWESGTGKVYTSTANVGIQTSSPNTALDINGAMSMKGMAAPALSPAGEGRIYFDSTAKKFKSSLDGAAYTDLATASYPLTGTNGLVGTPTYSFATQGSTGMYMPSSGQLAFTVGGTQRFRMQNESFYLGNMGSGGSSPATFSFDSRYYGNSGFTSTGRFSLTTAINFTAARSATVPGFNSQFYLSGDQDTGGLMGAGNFNFYSNTTGLFTGIGYGVKGSISTQGGSGNSTGAQSAILGVIDMAGAASNPTFTNVSAVRAQVSLTGVAAGGTHILTASNYESTVATAINDLIDTWYGVIIKAPTGAGTITTKYAIVTEAGSGNVGIGTLAPVSTLDVNGAIKSTAVTNSSATIDFSTGNLQYTSVDCGAMTLNNLKSGGTYTLAVQGTTGGTCSFTAYTGVATGGLTVKSGAVSLVQSANKHALFTFMVMGSFVYVASVDGY